MKILNILIIILVIITLVGCSNIKSTDEDITKNKTVTLDTFPKCPRGLKYEEYPGSCKLYQDTNNNNVCDLSE